MEERKVAGVIVDEMTAEAQTRAAMDELMGVDSDSHNMKFEKMYVVRDGETIEIEVPVDAAGLNVQPVAVPLLNKSELESPEIVSPKLRM